MFPAWLPPDLGRKFPPANVPIAILNLWNDAVDGVSETSQESHQQSADTAEDAVNHDAGDVGVDPGNNESSVEYSESESESDTGSESNDSQYSWPPSDREYELRQCRGIELPPDSSPPVLMAEDKSPSKSNIPITMENLDQPGPLMRASPPVQNSEPIRFGVVNVTDSQSSQLKAGDLELNYNDQFAQQFDVSTRDSNIPGDVQVEETPHKTPIKQLHSSRSEMHHSSTIAVPSTIEMSAEKQQTAQEGSLLSTERERRGRSPSKPLPRPTSPCSSEHSIEDADKHRNEKKRKLKNDEKENRLEAITRKVKRLNTNYGFSQDTPLSQDPILKASRMRERFRTKKGPSKVLSEASENTSRAAAPTLQEPHKGGIARTTYERFTEYYPQYTGDQDLFHGSCIRLSKVLATDLNFPESSWDDFIFYYSEGYQPYLERCMKRGEDPIPYVRFFAKMRKEPHCDQNIVTDISISDLLSARDVARNAPLQSETNQQSIVIVNSVGDKSSATTLQRCETEPKVSSRGFNNHKTKPRFFVEPGDEDTEADKVGEQDRRVGLYNRTAASSSKIEKTLHKDNKATTIPASRKEWFEEPNTPFKEFLTSYLKLKSVNGALGQVNEKGKTIRDTEPANILDWPV